uniref:Serine hydrolase domain-containing protein n=1 Tax=Haptolina brevifila TaxID=156173 RepID=A0A7S2J677_9EUKA|mmetsp:Transcript_7674/g.15658  ORF Transcript_7674/g.15658 Transcript_7674/m.15658 type:complete len:400 (+) Transcript_7674:54-1253(+)
MPSSRVLYLHGFGESSLVADMMIGPLREALREADVELLPHEAPNKLAPTELGAIVDPEYRAQCENGSLPAFCWYKLTDAATTPGGHRAPPASDFGFRSTSADQAAAVATLCAHIKAIGGVDGLVGFSQGGELACLVAEALAAGSTSLSASTAERLSFVATFGSEDVFTQRGKPPAAIPSHMRFFIAYGSADLDAFVDAATCAKQCRDAGAKVVVTHVIAGLGHGMPKEAAPYEEMIACMQAPQQETGGEGEEEKGGEEEEATTPAPQQRQAFPPKPQYWGLTHPAMRDISKEPRVWLVAEDVMKRALEEIQHGDEQERRNGFGRLQGALSNNTICTDLYSIEGAVDILKTVATSPQRYDEQSVSSAALLLGRFGFKEYDFTDPAVRHAWWLKKSKDNEA